MVKAYKRNIVFILAFMAYLGSLLIASPQLSHAQNVQKRGTPSILLNSKYDEFNLLPEYVRVFKDPDKKLNAASLLTKFNRGEGETVTSRKILDLSYQSDPLWVVFRVQNNNYSQSQWFLYLGSFADYVQGTSDRIAFFDLSYTNPLLMDGRTIDNKRQLFKQDLNAIPFTVKPSARKTFALYLEPTPGMATSIPLTIYNDEAYNKAQYKSDLSRNVIYMCTVLLFLLFVVFTFLYKDPLPIFLCGYLVFHYLMFMNNGELVSIGNDTTIELNAIIYALSYLTAGLIGLSTLWNIPTEQKRSFYIILSLMVLCTFAGLGAYFFSDTAFFLTLSTRYLPILAPLTLTLAFIFISAPPNLNDTIRTFIFAWALLFFAAFLTELAKANIFRIDLFQIHLYWLTFPFQIMILSFSAIKVMQINKDHNDMVSVEQNKQDDTERQMQRSKEVADQERLVHILQRERELLAELREREAERAVAMREAKEIADQANKAKSAFLAVISHEIRTPMTGIMGMIRLINRTPLNETQTEYIQTIESSGDTLLALLNDILDLSKVEEGKMQIEMINFNLIKLIKSVALLMTGRADEQRLDLKVEIEGDIPEILVGDPTRIRQILLNLISNAIKFTQKGHVTLECKLIEQDNNSCVIHLGVRDTGIGLDDATQKKLFTPFTQADASISRQFGGTGLGLTICKKLVNAMKGDIQIKSSLGEGSTFYFSLPFDLGYGEIEEDVDTQNLYVPPMTILVADDNEVNQKVVRSLLEHDKHKITTVSEGLKALQLLSQNDYDVIFMDMEMPGLSGIETTLKIRGLSNPDKADTPIIAMTANTMQEDINKCFDAGMNDYVSKPIDPDRLSEVLFNLVDNKLSVKDAQRQARLKAEQPSLSPKQNAEAPSAAQENRTQTTQAPTEITPIAAPPSPPVKTVRPADQQTADVNSSLAAEKHIQPTLAPQDVGIDPTPAHQIPTSANVVDPLEPKSADVSPKLQLPENTSSLHLEGQDPTTDPQKSNFGLDLTEPSFTEPVENLSVNKQIQEPQPVQAQIQQLDNPPAPPVVPVPPVEPTPPVEPAPPVAPEQSVDMSTLLFDDAVLGGLKDSLGGEAILDMMQDLYTTSDDLINKSEQSVREGDISAAGDRAHDLKGMSANFGLTGVSDIAGAIESGARNNASLEEIQSLVATLRPNYEQMKAQLVIWLNR